MQAQSLRTFFSWSIVLHSRMIGTSSIYFGGYSFLLHALPGMHVSRIIAALGNKNLQLVQRGWRHNKKPTWRHGNNYSVRHLFGRSAVARTIQSPSDSTCDSSVAVGSGFWTPATDTYVYLCCLLPPRKVQEREWGKYDGTRRAAERWAYLFIMMKNKSTRMNQPFRPYGPPRKLLVGIYFSRILSI